MNTVMKNLFYLTRTSAIYILGLLALKFLTSCASAPDWRENHYQTANSGAQCQAMCITGQIRKAQESGCSCEGIKPKMTVTSSSNGNTNNIYLNSNPGAQRPQNGADYSGFVNLFQNLYEMERRNREHSDKVRNGYYSNQDNE